MGIFVWVVVCLLEFALRVQAVDSGDGGRTRRFGQLLPSTVAGDEYGVEGWTFGKLSLILRESQEMKFCKLAPDIPEIFLQRSEIVAIRIVFF